MLISHLTDNVKKLLRERYANMAVIPIGSTPLVQPLDVCINKPFKANESYYLTNYRLTREQPLSSHSSQNCNTKISCDILGTPLDPLTSTNRR
ncbi:hypothetical protein TNCV_4210071 [Trichonephila clavipes]|nr:hypothetical protein TNCV_4210071 [Trichonephila clavipes]